MEQITFTSVELVSFGRDQTVGHAKFAASLTESIAKKLGIEDSPEWISSAKASDVELHGSMMTLRSKDGDLVTYQIEFEIGKVHAFEVVRLENNGTRGKGYRRELRFKVDFADLTGCRYLEEYITSAGDSKGTLTVSHAPKPPEQTQIPGMAEDQQPLVTN